LQIELFVQARLRLRLKARATRVQPTDEGVAFLGWRLFPGTVRLDRPRRRRLVRRVRAVRKGLAAGAISEESAAASMGSVVAWSRWGHTDGLRRALFAKDDPRGG
jgi:hypothetical protein